MGVGSCKNYIYPAAWRALAHPGQAARLPPLPKTFDKHEEARRWAHKLDGRIAADDLVDLSEARQTSLGEALERCLIEMTPAKKVAKQERNRIKAR
jgi:hypothetical protein